MHMLQDACRDLCFAPVFPPRRGLVDRALRDSKSALEAGQP